MFGVQVFTVPSVAAYLVSRHGFLSRAISILVAFFTAQYNPITKKSLSTTPNPAIHKVDLDSPAIKQKRYFQLISDLDHLISAPTVQPLICDTPSLMTEFAQFLDLFTGMNPNKRAVSTHVEYESDSWVTAFNLTIQLAKLCRAFGEAYRRANALQLARALSLLLSRMAGPRANVHTVDFGGTSYQLIDFVVGSQTQGVSFHHPLALLFAEMVKNIQALDPSQLALIGVSSLREVALGRAGPLHFLAAMDPPLRAVVLVAQIRAGLWVRNGFGIRAQHLHYKEYTMRENTYDQDVFFLQAALVILDPSLVFIAILDRFQALEWLAGQDAHPMYEATQAMTMVEEMVFLLIVMLSDPTHVTGEPAAVTIRRELVHTLCLGSAPYADILRRVSDRFADDPVLDKVLHEVATFKPPVGTTDQGVYTLRPACLAEVSPFFPRFSRNQREEADRIVREHLKKSGQHGADPVILPSRLEIKSGPYVELREAFKSEVLWQVIFFSLLHGKQKGELLSEVLVDEALHLTMLALVEVPAEFGVFAGERKLAPTGGQGKTLVEVLVELEEDERMKVVRHKVRWCLDRLTEVVGPSVAALRKVEEVKPDKALAAKRAAAQARRAAIMQQFAKAKQSFFDTNADAGEEDEDDDLDGDDGMEGEPKPVSMGSCIVCQDELDASRAFGALGLVQTSNLIRLSPEGKDNLPYQREVLAMPTSLDRDHSAIRPFGVAGQRVPVHPDDETGDGLAPGFPQHTRPGLHASACGHLMHLACFDTYCRSIAQRHVVQPGRCQPENVERHEFVCPLCKSLGNVLLPVRVEDEEFGRKRAGVDGRGLEEWAAVAVEPASLALEVGVEPDRVGRFIEIGKKLQLRTGTVGLDPWKVSRALPNQLPAKFAPGQRAMVARLLAVAEPLMAELEGPEAGERAAQLPRELVGYTLACLELAGRGQAGAPGVVGEAAGRMVRSLLASLEVIAEVVGEEVGKQIFTLAVVQHLGGIFAPPATASSGRTKQGLLELDPLASVVEVAAVYPAAFYHAAGFAFYAHLLQVFLSLGRWLQESGKLAPFVQGDSPEADAEAREYVQLAGVAHVFGPDFVAQGAGAEVTVGKHLAAQMTVFLRRVAVVRWAVFGDEVEGVEASEGGSELSRLMRLLRIPALSDALDPSSRSAIRSHVVALRASVPPSFHLSVPPLEHPVLYELLGLPRALDTLHHFALARPCPRCLRVPDSPALCLLCGATVCAQSYCCMDGDDEALHGECNAHMWTCGGSSGVFFLVKRNALLWLYADKGAFGVAPYLDGHGKADGGGAGGAGAGGGGGSGRGRALFPMFLHGGRYEEVRRIWVGQGVGTVVARKLDAGTDHVSATLSRLAGVSGWRC